MIDWHIQERLHNGRRDPPEELPVLAQFVNRISIGPMARPRWCS